MFLSDYGYMGPELIWMQIVGRVITKESILKNGKRLTTASQALKNQLCQTRMFSFTPFSTHHGTLKAF